MEKYLKNSRALYDANFNESTKNFKKLLIINMLV